MSKKYGLNELREMFLSFFETKEHLRLPSFSLIPQNDASLLIINSGMAPMKPYFKGEEEPPRHRICTCQKCIRTGDIENIGKTARHGTFFEMLGNFSFGDYFKHEAIAWSWEFLTSPEWVGLDPDRLYPSVYLDDDEAFAIWRDEIGIPEERIFKFGKEDNFWEHGAGPCGPCSEIYYDRGEKYGCGNPGCTVGCDCDRYIEVWNNVFSQFDNDGNNNYTELVQKNIDTGMGLERLAVVCQDVPSLFDVDTVINITNKVTELTGASYGQSDKRDVSLRVITDHLRSSVFMVSDGILPSNNGRGYVLRRLLRRASRHGKLLGVNEPFLYKIVETVVAESECQYPELREKIEFITNVIKTEEENFGKTIDQGMSIFNDMLSENSGKVFSGENAFKLYDTFGFPYDLTVEMCEEQGMTVDEDGFKQLMQQQKETARADRKSKGDLGWAGEEFGKDIPETEFIGYDRSECEAEVLAVQDGLIVLDATVLYAEMGGQVADFGVIESDKAHFNVTDVKKNKGGKFMHIGEYVSGSFEPGDKVICRFDAERRKSVARAHSATHLLQSALRNIEGAQVHQAGSLVEPDTLRFDFTAMKAVDIHPVEKLVNEYIMKAMPVNTVVMGIEEAKKSGATALFGEKYSENVRVVSMGDVSSELCGGTHISNTAEICSFKILSEGSVASGVRRITAVTGAKVAEYYSEQEKELNEKIIQLNSEIKDLKKTIDQYKAKDSAGSADSLLKNAVSVNGKNLVVAKVDLDPNSMRTLGDHLRDKDPSVVAVLYSDKTCLCVCGKNSGANAVDIIRSIGKGGGKPESAMGSINGEIDINKIKEML